LHGDAYEEAKAYYELTGEALERRLLEIRTKTALELKRGMLEVDYKYRRITSYEYERREAVLDYETGDELDRELLHIDLRHGKITQYEADRKLAEIDHPIGAARDLALLEVEYRHNKLTKTDYEKQCATLKNEPWIAIVDSGFDPEQGIDGVFFEFDWNKAWIEFLKINGYIGNTDEQIVDDWFSDVCRSYVNPEINPNFPKLDLP
jgi:hypothetical protein